VIHGRYTDALWSGTRTILVGLTMVEMLRLLLNTALSLGKFLIECEDFALGLIGMSPHGKFAHALYL